MKIQIVIATLLAIIDRSYQKTSPCPSVFTYEEKEDTADTWFGTLRLKTNVPLHGIFIDLIFDSQIYVLGAYFRDITTKDNLSYHIEDKSYRLNDGETLILKFYVKYSEYARTPLLRQVRFNGQNICVDVPTLKSTTTRPTAPAIVPLYEKPIVYPDEQYRTQSRPKQFSERTNNTHQQIDNSNRRPQPSETVSYDPIQDSSIWRKPTSATTSRSIRQPDYVEHYSNSRTTSTTEGYNQGYRTTTASSAYFQGDHQVLNSRSTTSKKPAYFQGDYSFIQNVESSTHYINSYDEDICGTIVLKANPLVTHGASAQNAQFPWHGALYRSTVTELKYLCGATLISARFTLTAAHCVALEKSTRSVDPDSLLMYFGKTNLKKWNGPEEDAKILDIYIHPNYDYERFFADIALLKLKEDVKFSSYVRPACLWDFDEDYKILINKIGFVPGWGYNERGLVSEELSFAQMPIVAHETCIWSNRDFFSKVTSNTSYCAGFRNGTSVCNGDSGGGMVFKQHSKWYLRGIVSVSAALQNKVSCDPNHYAVFTDVAKYLRWIRSLM